MRNNLLIKLKKSYIGTLFSYWLFQSMFYMDIREATFKVFIDIVGILLLRSFKVPLLVAFIIAHTFNMFINGHFYALKSHAGKNKISPQCFIKYVEKLYNRLQQVGFMLGAAAYGGLSRNIFSPTSDIDIRIFPKKGFFNWLKAILWVFAERARAAIRAFPIDIYVFDLDKVKYKIKPDEPPIIMHDPEQVLNSKYEAGNIDFNEFVKKFKEEYIND